MSVAHMVDLLPVCKVGEAENDSVVSTNDSGCHE